MTGLTPKGFPYPDPTDLLRNGADAIKALALAVDGHFYVGTVALNVVANNTAVQQGVNFPRAFSVVPLVLLVPNAVGSGTTPVISAWVTNTTVSGFTANVNKTLPGNVPLIWLAIPLST